MARTYPRIPDDLAMRVEAVRLAGGNDPEYLQDPLCPYPQPIKLILRRLVPSLDLVAGDGNGSSAEAGTGETNPVFHALQTDVERIDSFLTEIDRAINDLRALENKIENANKINIDVNERLSLIKQKTALLEKWGSLQEKGNGLRHMYAFQSVVMTALSKMLDPDQIEQFKKLLREENAKI